MASEASTADVLSKLYQASYPLRDFPEELFKPEDAGDRLGLVVVAAYLALALVVSLAAAGLVRWEKDASGEDEGPDTVRAKEPAIDLRAIFWSAGSWLALTGIAAVVIFHIPSYPGPPDRELVAQAVQRDVRSQYDVSHVTPVTKSSSDDEFVRKLWKTRTGNVVPAPTVKVQLEDHSVATYKVYLAGRHVKLAQLRSNGHVAPSPVDLLRAQGDHHGK